MNQVKNIFSLFVISLTENNPKSKCTIVHTGPMKVALGLPVLTRGHIQRFEVLLFGDSPISNVNSQSSAGLHLSVSALLFSQRKEPSRTVTVPTVVGQNSGRNCKLLNIPTGECLFVCSVNF